MKTKTLSRIANVSFAIAIISALSVAVFASPPSAAGLIKGKFTATAKQAAICSQKIFRANFMVETKQISFEAGQRMARGCKAYIARYDAKLNKDREDFLKSIKGLNK